MIHFSPKKCVLAIPKGGVGKSTLVFLIGRALSVRSTRCLVDMDPQASLTTLARAALLATNGTEPVMRHFVDEVLLDKVFASMATQQLRSSLKLREARLCLMPICDSFGDDPRRRLNWVLMDSPPSTANCLFGA